MSATMLQATAPTRPDAAPARLTHGPVLPVLAGLAVPNVLAMVAVTFVSIAETIYVGLLGKEALAAMAVVFPLVILMLNLSSGAMGGAVSSAISRALGANELGLAQSLARHAVVIAVAAGLLFTAVFLLAGPLIYSTLGARERVHDEAISYATTLFAGAVPIWLANTFISIARGTGNMRVPAITILGIAALQVALGAALGLGWGLFPRWGMRGVAAGQVLAYAVGALCLAFYLFSAQARVRLAWKGQPLRRDIFWRILRTGLLACLSPVQTVLTVLVLTALISRLGVDALAGYGIGARLEFMVVPIAFGVGVATLTMVGMAIGRLDVARARRVAWTGGALSATMVGLMGAVVCVWPHLWAGMFTTQPEVLRFAGEYLRWAGPGYAFFGLGLTLFFASQGAGRVLGPVLGGTLRLAMVCVGGWALSAMQADSWTYFALTGAAMLGYGLFTAASVLLTDWHPLGKATHTKEAAQSHP